MKKMISVLLVLVLLAVSVSAQEHFDDPVHFDESGEESAYDQEFNKALEEDIYEDIGDVKLKGSAGLTPDSNFYFLEGLVESVMVGDNPETALKYKEEKVLELKEMVESGNQEGAEKALEGVEKYNEIIKKEVSPEIEREVRESSKAVKEVLNSFELEEEEWEDVKEIVDENIKGEDKIALAAKISKQIDSLCRTLSQLDPLEYSKICKTGDDAPQWKGDMDRELTAEQEKEAKEFFGIMSQCFEILVNVGVKIFLLNRSQKSVVSLLL